MKMQVKNQRIDHRRDRKFWRICGVGAISLTAFVKGFWVDPVYLRMIWVLVAGTASVISGIILYLVSNRFM